MIVGTAGHVDHGKTALVRCLTGVDTDRLKEEKIRGITIELGFAYVELPSGYMLGFVDVPGHERLVQTMVAGAASIEYVLLVVAADDGLMPQTYEHLHILDFIGIRHGLVVLTKVDLVDEARAIAVCAEIRSALSGLSMCGAEIVRVSAVTGEGIRDLQNRLEVAAKEHPRCKPWRSFRMGVDRCFTITGSGTIVTGSVLGGVVRVGDRVILLPSGLEARVRGIRAQSRATEIARRGERCALNLTGPGISKEAVRRGDWVVVAEHATVTSRFDAQIRTVPNSGTDLTSRGAVYLHVGTTAVAARIIPLSDQRIKPGSDGLVQVVMPISLPLRHGDRVVLRDIGATRTIGGGVILDVSTHVRKRRTAERLAALKALQGDCPEQVLARLLELSPGLVCMRSFAADWGLLPEELDQLVSLFRSHFLLLAGDSVLAGRNTWESFGERVVSRLADLHREHPHRSGFHAKELRVREWQGIGPDLFIRLVGALALEGRISSAGASVYLIEREIWLSQQEQYVWKAAKALLQVDWFRPPTVRDLAVQLHQPLKLVRLTLRKISRTGEVIEIEKNRYYLATTIREVADIAARLAKPRSDRSYTVSELRDALGCGRDSAVQLAEYFDRMGMTCRHDLVHTVINDPEIVFTGATSGA